jgi:hypothetical protein
MVQSSKRMLEVAREKVLELEDRYPGYRADLLKSLAGIIGAQAASASERIRREAVVREIEALASKVRVKTDGGNS